MPELPEVETTLRGIEPHLTGRVLSEVLVRRSDLRQEVSPTLSSIEGKAVVRCWRRSKYLLLEIEDGSTVLIHLGMSGSLRLAMPGEEWKTHDHVAFSIRGGRQMRFHDPRRFGLVLHLTGEPMDHPLLSSLGPEPLEDGFTASYLHAALSGRGCAIKLALIDNKVVVGVGNIYASESLFRAGIRPSLSAKRVSRVKVARLVSAVREVLADAIREGGTTLRDFLHADGQPGYFRQRLFVYERKGEPCRKCGTEIRQAVMGQRSTYWCPDCQK